MQARTKWLLGLLTLTSLAFAGCVVNNDEAADESTDGELDINVDGEDTEGGELQCTGRNEDHGDTQTGTGRCEVEG